ncbi:MAG: chromosome segregation protein SMC [Synergistaceae bacterium]|nr:chromosome segregation protein SMC [Synergistaceae bacterium]
MSIEYLRLKGFKSFGTSCEFFFSEGLTAIVGPNGSGKSNILDALRWVLGEGAPGTLRIMRQSDLIFQGSASMDPAKEAEVILKLKQKGTGEPTPLAPEPLPASASASTTSTSTLRRQYTVESGSVLQVDGTKIRLQDLADFKARFMLEGDSFAFIGQGEVSEAIHQRPMERRRHLELLFGIDRYRKRREETYLKLESAMTELQRINTLLADLAARREEIAPEVAVAVEAKGIIDNLENIRRDFYFSHRFSLEKKEQDYRSQLQLTAENKDLAGRWKALWFSAVSKTEEKLRSEGFDEQAFLAKERELVLRKESLRRQSFSAATRVKGILSNRRDGDAELERVSASLSSVKSEMEKMRNQEATLQGELEEKRAALEDALRRMEESRSTAERERMRRQELQDEYADKTLSRSKLEARLKALSLSQERSGQDFLRLEEERTALAATVEKLESESAAVEKHHEKLSLEHSDIYTLCQKHAANLQHLKRELVTQEAELDAIKENTEASIYPEPTLLLLSASRLGKMTSKPEVVAEAFSCPAEVAPALEAYLGGRQFWLLVHTFDEAQEGIELLKQRRAGRVTYLPLERCRPRFPDTRYRLPLSGVVGWGIELITPRAPWEPALQHLMGDLLVVKDYALGSGMVKSGAKFPIVTVEGEVFSPAGTVSGGRTRQSGGAISHNQRVTELSVHIDALKRKIKGVESELARAEKEEQAASQERDKLGAALNQIRGDLAASRQTLAAVLSEIERLGGEKSSAESELQAGSEELSRLDVRIAELEAQIAELRDPSDPGGDTPSSSLRGEMELIEERLRGTANVLARVQREHGDLEDRMASVAAELEAGRSEEKSLKEQLSQLGKEQYAIWQEVREIRRTLEEERDKARKVHDRLQRLRARGQKAESNLTALVAEAAALSERISSTRAEIEQLQELWDEKYPYDVHEASRTEGGRDLVTSMRRLERELKALGSYNLGALSEDESLTERIDYLTEQLEDVRGGVEELKTLIDETDSQVETLFTQAMTDIDDRFNSLFQRLFAGGEARLTLQEEGAIWDKGVEIYARPPGKRLQNISQLSGGEQSLTAIAHLFAALEVARMPLAVLDEVDAALDEYNLIRFADLAKEYSHRLQLLVMTHRRTTMERADLIYGVTMVEPGLSKIVAIDVENYK